MKTFKISKLLMSILLLILASCQTEMSLSEGNNWPGFRGYGYSRTSANNLPVKWSETQNIAWAVDINGYGQSSPVVWDEKIYITSVEGSFKEKLYVLCYDLRDGRLKWKKEIKASQKIKNSLIILVAHEGPSYLVSLDKKIGENIWKQDRVQQVSWTSPIVSDYQDMEQILISSNATAAAYEASTRKLIWEMSGLKRNTVPSPTVYENLVILGSSDKGWNLALNRESKGKVGKEAIVWQSDISSSSFGSPLVNRKHVYFISKVGMLSC